MVLLLYLMKKQVKPIITDNRKEMWRMPVIWRRAFIHPLISIISSSPFHESWRKRS